MKTYIFIFAAIVVLNFLVSCEKNSNCIRGTGGYTTREYNISDFDRLEMSGMADVYMVNDEQTTLRIEGQENILSVLSVEVKNNALKIGEDNCFKEIKKLKVYVSTPTLKGVYSYGVCDIYSPDTFSSPVFNAELSGTGTMDLNLDVDEFSSSISGDGDIKASGTARFQKYHISGVGKYDCFDLMGDDAEIDISGIGNLEVNVSNSLDIDISGSGNILYKGNPTIKQDVSGSGNIINAY